MTAPRLLALALLGALAASPACAQEAAPAAAPGGAAPLVTVTQARAGEMVATVEVTGTLVAREDVVVAPQIEGLRIVEIRAEEGDRVVAGQILARLSRETLEAQLAQSTAQIARADAAIAQANATIAQAQAALAQSAPALDRARALARTGAGTDAQLEARQADQAANLARLDAARQGLLAAQADRKALQAARDELDIRLARTDVKAPAAGLISRRAARIGAIASSASPDGLFRIVADGAVELDAEAPDFRLVKIRVGQPARVFDASGAAHSGRVRLISPQIDKTTRMGSLRVALDPDPQLRVGGFARGEVEIARRQALSLPASAVLETGAGARVELVREGAVTMRAVQTGLIVGDRVEIRAGVDAGDEVVARAGAFLNDGDKVRVRKDGASEGGAK